MKPELDKKLCEKYPKIFVDRHAPMQVTAMCWGFECGDGWYPILDELCSKVQEECDLTGEQIKATQVKEKFGTLRFYTDYTSDKIRDLIEEAAKKSAETCERCGNPGKVRGKGWYYCACDDHTDKEDLCQTNHEQE